MGLDDGRAFVRTGDGRLSPSHLTCFGTTTFNIFHSLDRPPFPCRDTIARGAGASQGGEFHAITGQIFARELLYGADRNARTTGGASEYQFHFGSSLPISVAFKLLDPLKSSKTSIFLLNIHMQLRSGRREPKVRPVLGTEYARVLRRLLWRVWRSPLKPGACPVSFPRNRLL